MIFLGAMHSKSFSSYFFLSLVCLSYAIGGMLFAAPPVSPLMDEIFSVINTQPVAFSAIASSVAEGPNQAPPLYFYYLWVWGHVFGWSWLSLKLSSSLLVLISICLQWWTLRKIVNIKIATLVVVCFWGSNELLQYHNQFVRFYSLHVLLISLSILLYVSDNNHRPIIWVIMTWLVHTAMAYTFYVGTIVSGLVCLAYLVTETSWKFRLIKIMPFFMTAISFLPWLPFMIEQNSGGTPDWLFKQGPIGLVNMYGFGINGVVFALGISAALVLIRSEHFRLNMNALALKKAKAIAFTFVFFPLIAWIFMQVNILNIFWDRYLLNTPMCYPILMVLMILWIGNKNEVCKRLNAGSRFIAIVILFFVSTFPILKGISDLKMRMREAKPTLLDVVTEEDENAVVYTDSYRLFLRQAYHYGFPNNFKLVAEVDHWTIEKLSFLIGEQSFTTSAQLLAQRQPFFFAINQEDIKPVDYPGFPKLSTIQKTDRKQIKKVISNSKYTLLKISPE